MMPLVAPRDWSPAKRLPAESFPMADCAAAREPAAIPDWVKPAAISPTKK